MARSILFVLLSCLLVTAASAQSLRFYGHGGSPGENFVFPDRVKIDRAPPSTLASFGTADFTVEFFLRATAAENPNVGACGSGIGWVNSNIIIDADRFGQPRAWGIGLLDGRIAFGITDDFDAWTLCGSANVLDDQWHHVAVDRQGTTGRMRIWVDGVLDGLVSGGPGGTLAYEAGFIPSNLCDEGGGSGGESCINSDPFLVFGAEKHGFQDINYSGFLDEVKLSSALRYTTPFTPPTQPFTVLPDTVALYHFDEPSGNAVQDDVAPGADGTLFFGGTAPAGPVRSAETPFAPEVPGLGSAAGRLLLAVLGGAGLTARRRAASG